MAIQFSVNGKSVTLDVPPEMPLLWALRDVAGLTGTKFGCGIGLCGACTVHLDGQTARSCITPMAAVQSRAVTTIEGIGAENVGRAVQNAWQELAVPQCGYCQAGQIMAAAALLHQKAQPSDADIDQALSGNLCRCGTYTRIRAAIKRASAAVATGASSGAL